MTAFDHIMEHQYINLETFRKNGKGVRTPVWFVQDGDTLLVRTITGSGKVKRIRNHGQVNIAPCQVNGEVVGDWMPAAAREVRDPDTAERIDQLLDQKYGLAKKMFAAAAALQGRNYTVLEIRRLD